MNSWIDLPNEILDNIFQRLSGVELKQCSLTCSAWIFCAQRNLFKCIVFRSNQRLTNIANTLSIYQDGSIPYGHKQSPANFVKNVEFEYIKNNKSITLDLSLLDELFPSVEGMKCWRINETMYDKFYSLMTEGKFINIKRTTLGNRNKTHVEILLARRKNIEELSVMDITSDTNPTFEIFHKLHLFFKLEKLALYCKNKCATICLETLLIKSPSTLRAVRIGALCNITFSASTLDINNIQPWENLKELTILNLKHLIPGDDKALVYIMKKFPNLSKLIIYSKTNHYYQRPDYTVPTMPYVNQFLKYVFNMKQCYVFPIFTGEITADVIKNIISHSICQKSTEILLSINFYVPPMVQDSRSSHYIGVRKVSPGHQSSCMMNITYNTMNYMDSYMELCEKIKHLEMDFLTIGSGAKLLRDEITIEVDEIVFRLRKLHLKNIRKILFRDNMVGAESTLEKLKLSTCYLNEEMFSHISKRCPRLKSLEINACLFIDAGLTDQYKHEDQIITIKMPYTCLKQMRLTATLKRCYASPDVYKIYIKLHTNQKKPRYCKINIIYNTNEDTIIAITEAEYQDCLRKDRRIVYDINCHSVQVLIVDFFVKDRFGYSLINNKKLHLEEEDL